MTLEQFNELRRQLDVYRPPSRLHLPRVTGVSSDALVRFAFTGADRPSVPGRPAAPGAYVWHGDECGRDHPADEADLAACVETVRLAHALDASHGRWRFPALTLRRMDEVLVEFSGWVLHHVNRYGDKLDEVLA